MRVWYELESKYILGKVRHGNLFYIYMVINDQDISHNCLVKLRSTVQDILV